LVGVPRSTSLRHLAAKSGIEMDQLERLNPELRLKQTPPDGPYLLKVPLGGASQISVALDREGASRRQFFVMTRETSDRRSKLQTVEATNRLLIHIVKRQETLSGIAKRYGVSVDDLVRWNGLDQSTPIVPGARLRVVVSLREEMPSGSR
jgi:membrane-bound lytic murein transglycosylase D